MPLEPNHCYQALLARDTRFDGRFFVGVTSTGIYCRPVCPVRTPRRTHCRFFANAASAEAEGFRPCLRCRPELAPGLAAIDAGARFARAAAVRIEDGMLNEAGVVELAARLGVTDRHLRRVFHSEFGVSPVQYAQTQRLLLAKQLLTDTSLPLTEVALAAGFGSVRRFNALFQARYRLSPGALRRTASAQPEQALLRFELSYRPPLDWAGLARFLGARAIPGVEDIDGQRYRRTVHLQREARWHSGWIEVEPVAGRHALAVTLAPELAPVIAAVLKRVKLLFDLACHPDEIAAVLGPLAAPRPGLRVPGSFDSFEMSVRAILGQQVSVRAAGTLAARFTERFGAPLATPFEALVRTFPTPARIAQASVDDIAALGIVGARARAIVALARALAEGELVLGPEVDIDATLDKLCELPGIGPWTAHYIAMRALAWPDAFPAADMGVLKALGTRSARESQRRSQIWQPWRAYAVMHLWHGGAAPVEDSA